MQRTATAKNGHTCTNPTNHVGAHGNEYGSQCAKNLKLPRFRCHCHSCHKIETNLSQKRYQKRNPAKVNAKNRKWSNSPAGRKNKNQYYRKRYHNDLVFRLIALLRVRFREALTGRRKSTRTLKLLGCSVKELKIHLERQFPSGMSWENREKWHIDHIIPCSKFDLADPAQQRACFHYSNLQPLWAVDNIRKGGRVLD